jgi:hypothetical protein
MAKSSPRKNQYILARQIALRLARAGEQPYADDCEQYVVLEGERGGEVIEFGRPLRDHRMFPVKSQSKNNRLAEQFAAFAAVEDRSAWCLWTVCRPSRKTQINELEEDYRQFNDDINRVLTELRKRCEFELLLIGIHIRFDRNVGLFDIHAHFVCRIPMDRREEARRRLMTAFSRCHLPDNAIRSPQGVARYISKTFKLEEVVKWPKKAMLAAWNLGGNRFHYCRTAGRFAGYRRDNRPPVDPHRQKTTQEKRSNRAETRHPDWEFQDRRLVRRTWRFGDQEISGTLYRRAPACSPQRPATMHPVHPEAGGPAAPTYPSTDTATTQATPTARPITPQRTAQPTATTGRGVVSTTLAALQKLGRLAFGGLKRILCRLVRIHRKNE